MSKKGEKAKRQSEIQITAVQIRVAYNTVLELVPPMHQRPPQLPESEDSSGVEPPSSGYDLILHCGVGDEGHIAIEQLAHKCGYELEDVDGRKAPPVCLEACNKTSQPRRRAKGGGGAKQAKADESRKRGFGVGYEEFAEEIESVLDADAVAEHLRKNGFEHVESSRDPGRYLCDFIYYCSLAESMRRSCDRAGATSNLRGDGKATPSKVLFMHVPPTGRPYSVKDMTGAMVEVIKFACTLSKFSCTRCALLTS
jgi:pyroglutamyl-peptidase